MMLNGHLMTLFLPAPGSLHVLTSNLISDHDLSVLKTFQDLAQHLTLTSGDLGVCMCVLCCSLSPIPSPGSQLLISHRPPFLAYIHRVHLYPITTPYVNILNTIYWGYLILLFFFQKYCKTKA